MKQPSQTFAPRQADAGLPDDGMQDTGKMESGLSARPARPDGRDAVLSIGAGETQLPLIRAATAAGFTVWAVDRADRPAALPHLAAHLACSTYDSDAVAAAARTHPLAARTRAVIQRTSGPALATAAAAAAALGIAGPSPAFCAAAVRKSELRRAASALGLPCPRGWLVDGAQAAEMAAELPDSEVLIAKPDMPIHGKAAIARLPAGPRDRAGTISLLRQAAAASANGQAEVQAWLPGRDVGLMLLLAGGRPRLALAYDEIVTPCQDGTVRGLGLAAPSTCMGAAQLAALALPLAGALGMTRGFAFFSFRVEDERRAHLYEVNPGLCGDGIADRLLPAVLPGFDPFAAEIAAWTGDDLPPAGASPSPVAATLLGDRLLPGDAAANAGGIAAAAIAAGGRWIAAAA